MDPDSTILPKLALLLALVLVNAFFAASEIAIVTFNDNKLKKMADDGNKKAKMLVKMVSEPSKFLSSIQVGVTLSGFLASASAAEQFQPMLTKALSFIPIQTSVLSGIALLIITLAISYVSLVLGELVPKRIAMHNPEKISLAVAPIVYFLYRVEKPLVAVLSFSTNIILRLIGIDPANKPEQVTEEEIRMMIDVGNEEGTIEQSERDMIDNIFEFDDITAEDVMTHRTEIAAVESTSTIPEVVRMAMTEGYSRIPVYKEDIDDIIGIVYAKDMLRFIGKGEESLENRSIEPFIREVIFVPESNRCTDLFKTFKDKKIQMAVVVDEYGGTSGIVTMEDLLEAIVGNMQDEYDNEEEEFSKISDHIFNLDGSMAIEDVEKLLHIKVEDGEDYDTLSGLLTDLLDRIPSPDEHPIVQIENVEFTVLLVEDRRIAKVRAEMKQEESPESQEEK